MKLLRPKHNIHGWKRNDLLNYTVQTTNSVLQNIKQTWTLLSCNKGLRIYSKQKFNNLTLNEETIEMASHLPLLGTDV